MVHDSRSSLVLPCPRHRTTTFIVAIPTFSSKPAIMHFALVILFVAAVNAAPLLRVSEPIQGRYIVKIKSGIDVQSVLPSVRLAGGRVHSVYKDALNGFAAELSDQVLDLVLNLPAVEYVEEDGVVRAMATQWGATWGLDRIDQRSLPLDNQYTSSDNGGEGVTVYVIDTGIRISHDDFGGRASYGADFTGQGDGDGNGHGTHCAGTVGGTEFGVAKGVNLKAVKVLGRFGSGSTSGVIGGVNWVASDASGKKAVASMSLGGGASSSLDEAVTNLIDSGVPTAVAAGNSNEDASNSSPARAPDAVTVGSTDNTDTRSSFSNYGSYLDIFAPGSSITSAWIGSDSDTRTISGTSMACPHVAGALALLSEKYPGYTPLGLRNQLVSDATSDVVSDPRTGSPNRLLYVNSQ